MLEKRPRFPCLALYRNELKNSIWTVARAFAMAQIKIFQLSRVSYDHPNPNFLAHFGITKRTTFSG